MENMTEKALDFAEKHEAAAPAPAQAPAPAPEPAPAAEPEAKQDQASEAKAEPQPEAKTEEPARQPGETKAEFEKRVLKAVIGGQLREVDEDTLIKLADRGYDYESRRAALEEQAREIEKLAREIGPYKEEIDKRRQAEQEEEEVDPFLRLQKEVRSTKEELAALKREREQIQRVQSERAAVDTLNRSVESAKAKHDIFKSLPESVARKVSMNIYGAIAYGGKTPEQAVAEEAADLRALISQDVQAKAKAAISRAKAPAVPGKGAPPVTPAVKMDRKALYNGAAYEAAMRLIEAREAE